MELITDNLEIEMKVLKSRAELKQFATPGTKVVKVWFDRDNEVVKTSEPMTVKRVNKMSMTFTDADPAQIWDYDPIVSTRFALV